MQKLDHTWEWQLLAVIDDFSMLSLDSYNHNNTIIWTEKLKMPSAMPQKYP